MHLIHPAALFWAAVAVPIVLLHLLQSRPRRLPVASRLFWQQMPAQGAQTTAGRRLHHVLSLLLQLLVVLLLVLTLARPTAVSDTAAPRRLALILDHSLSMQATAAGVSRLTEARAAAQQWIQSLRPDDQLALITGGTPPQLLCPLTSDQSELTARLQQAELPAETPQLAAAVELARLVLAAEAPPGPSSRPAASSREQLILLTDGCCAEAVQLAADPAIGWQLVGTPVDNVAVARLQVRRMATDPASCEVFAEVVNFGTRAVRCRLQLDLNDQPVDVVPLLLPPGGAQQYVTTTAATTGGRLTAAIRELQLAERPAALAVTADSHRPSASRVTARDAATINGLLADDLADVTLPSLQRIPVTLVTEGNVFLEQVLQAQPQVDLRITQQLPEELPPDGVLVLHAQSLAALPDSHTLVIDPQSSCNLWEITGRLTQPVVAQQDAASRILQHVALDECRLAAAVQLRPVGAHQVLAAAADNSPLLLQYQRGPWQTLVLPFGLEQGDLPLRTAFPVLFANALAALTGTNDTPLLDEGLAAAGEGQLCPAMILRNRPSMPAAPPAPALTMWLMPAALGLLVSEWWLYHRRWTG